MRYTARGAAQFLALKHWTFAFAQVQVLGLISPLTWDSRIRVSPSFWAVSRELSFRSRRGSQREPARLRPAWRCR